MKKTILINFFLILLAFTSCSKDSANETTITSLALKVSNNVIVVNTALTYTVVTDAQADVTANASLYVNGSKVKTPYTPSKAGDIEIYASYNGIESNKVKVTVANEFKNSVAAEFKEKLIVEDYQGTWCGACPFATNAIKKLKDTHKEAVIPIGIHFRDIMQNEISVELVSHFRVTNYPTIHLDRKEWGGIFSNDYSKVTSEIAKESQVAIGIGSTIENSDVKIQVDIEFKNKPTKSNKLAVYLLENGIIADQVGANPPENYVHDHVLRHALTKTFGDEIPSTAVSSDKKYTVKFDKKVTDFSRITNFANSEIVAIVFDADGNVINSQHLKIEK